MLRLTLFLLCVFAFVTVSFAAPVPSDVLEKRVTHTGRVNSILLGLFSFLIDTQGTYFEVGLGACGKWNKDSDHIVALGTSMYQSSGGHCGQVMYNLGR